MLYAYLLDDAVPKARYAKRTVHIFDGQTPIVFIAKRGEREYEIFTEVDFEQGGRMGKRFGQYAIAGKKRRPRAMFTGPADATPQNLAPGLVMSAT